MSPQRRKAQLLRCAISAFAEYGVARATHAHVAKSAHVSVSAVHSYFRTREDLVAATLEEVERLLMPIVTKAVRNATARGALTEMVAGFDGAAREYPDLVKVWLDWSTGFRDEVWPSYLAMQERIHKQVCRVLARGKRRGELSSGLNAKAAARLYVGGGQTVALMRFSGVSEREIEILIDHLILGVTNIGKN